MHYVQQILLYRICHTVHQSKRLKYTNFSLHVHEFGTMSVMIVFFFYVHVCTIILSSFVLRHRDINVDASNIQNIHTQVSAVHSVSDAVSVVFVSEGFTNTNVV